MFLSPRKCLFLAQASLFLLVSFSRGFFAAIRPWRPDSHSLLCTVDVEMCLLLELYEAFIWATISEADNFNERIICSRVNSGSSWEPVSSLRFMVFATALEETFKVLEIVRIDWPSCLKVVMDCHFSLLIWAVLAIIWTWSFTKSSVYQPYLVTAQLIGSNALRRKGIQQINFYQGTPVNWNAFKLGVRMPRVCKDDIKAKGDYFEESHI